MLKRIFIIAIACLAASPLFGQENIDLFAKPLYKPLFGEAQSREATRLEPGSIQLARSEIDNLLLSRRGSVVSLPSLDRFTRNQGKPLEFRRVELVAPGARVYLIAEDGQREVQRKERHYYLAMSTDISVGVMLDPELGDVSGVINRKGQYMKVGGNFASSLEVSDIVDSPQTSASCGNSDISMGEAAQSLASTQAMPSSSAAAAGSAINYQATVAIDTDNEWMDGFGDDPTEATDWITELFVWMNVFFERDVELQLLIGDIYLRTTPDDYTVSGSSSAKLDEFSEYWTNNMSGVNRTFAAMLSGRNISTYSFSGIAWVDVYCEDGWYWASADRHVGSYSYNAIGSGWSSESAALYIGHELGHNLGSGHTHCYSPPVDTCYNGQSGCYDEAVACPAGGKGTIMSYCHVGGDNGAGCGTSNKEFHPRVQSQIEGRLASNLGSCIVEYADSEPDPVPDFDSNPAAGALIDLGDQLISDEGASASISVDNLGTAALTLDCALTGAQAGSFNVTSCVSSLDPAGNTNIGVSCEPDQLGLNQAVLSITTNDPSQTTAAFNLQCNGTAPPAPEYASSPSAGASINLGNEDIGVTTAFQTIQVTNSGAANLNLSCSLLGAGAPWFDIDACPTVVPPSSAADVEVSCAPLAAGSVQATVRISTNDADEAQNDYTVSCAGNEPPAPDDMIFSDSFGG